MNAHALSILWVEDHQNTSLALAKILRSMGHRVEPAATLAQAADLAREIEFDLLLADITLPDGSGLGLPRTLRKFNPLIWCVAITGHGGADAIAQGAQAGFDHYLLKPLAIEKLEEVLSKCDVCISRAGLAPESSSAQPAM